NAVERFELAQAALVLSASLQAYAPELRRLNAGSAPADFRRQYPSVQRLVSVPAKLGEAIAAARPKLRRFAARATAHLREALTREERLEVLRGAQLLLPRDVRVAEPLARYELFSANDTLIDAVVGIRYGDTEARLPRGKAAKKLYGVANTYIDWNLPDYVLQTSYEDLQAAFEALAPRAGETLVDLGSGYGRVGFFLAVRHPEVKFVGYEIVKERVVESRRIAEALGVSDRVRFEEADMAAPEFRPERAALYFAYDPMNERHYAKLLADLEAVAREVPYRLAAFEGRGRFLATLRSVPWLRPVKELPSVRPLPFPILVLEAVSSGAAAR
ncbi:MAG: SAM-dependent methyltransferase, partial [Myxococcales bacterium]